MLLPRDVSPKRNMDYSVREYPTLGSNLNQTTYYTPYDATYESGMYGDVPYENAHYDAEPFATNIPVGIRATGTCSFSSIDAQVFDNLRYEETETEYYHTMQKARPKDPAVGELMPLGDGVGCMLACTVLLAMVIYVQQKKAKRAK